jgi:hypothetical protein
MAKQGGLSGTEVVQVELSTPHTTIPGSDLRMVIWVEASLKPKVGMLLVRPNDDKHWEVTEAYPGIVTRMEGVGSHWKEAV